MTNARETLSRYIHVGWDQEQRIIEAMKEYTRSVIDECIELSRLKWAAGESGALVKEDGEILKSNLV